MEFSTLFDSLMSKLGGAFPAIVGAVAILAVGWLVALALRAVVRRSLGFLKLNERVRAAGGSEIDVERGVAAGVYYVVLALALIAFFNTLNLAQVSQPLESMVEQVLTYLPSLVAGGVLILVAWLAATLLRLIANKALASTRLDERLASEAGVRPISESLGHVVYGLVLLLFLPAVLDTLGLDGLLLPVQGMLDEVLGLVPNIAGALVLGLVGWIVGRILQNLVTNLLATTGVDKFGHRAGLRGTMSLSALVGVIVFVFVFVPALIAALDALAIEAISDPATQMLQTMMNAIPGIFAAALILVVAFFIAEFVADLASSLLAGIGFDGLPARLGLGRAFPETVKPSGLVSKLIVFAVLLFAGVEAAKMLGFARVSELVALFIQFGGQVLLGTAIIGIGLWLANVAYDAVARLSRPDSAALAGLARFTILGLVLAMGLRAMGIADEIVILAFALPLGAVALAAALSFGLGGREAAGRQVEEWLSRYRGAE